MEVLLAATELAPYAKTGGLADVLASLPPALADRGHRVQVCLPLYRRAIRRLHDLKPMGTTVEIALGQLSHRAAFWSARTREGIPLLLVERDEFFDRTYLYGPPGRDYEDNAHRFFFFSKAIIEITRRQNPRPKVLHLHDWHTGIAAALAHHENLDVKTVFTIHNIAYQGCFPGKVFDLTNLPSQYFSPEGLEFYGKVNCLKAGIVFASRVTTVSPRYAQEIQTPEGGYGLDGVLRRHAQKLVGILNGADYRRWNPATDPKIPSRFDRENLKGKEICKEALLRQLGLSPGGAPLFLFLGRLVPQKGIELLLEAIPRLLEWGGQVVILGSGEPHYEERLRRESDRNRDRCKVQFRFSEVLAHRMIAGADFLLMPSLYEPCGLAQMYALRYGTLPIAYATGGLADTIENAASPKDGGTGFLFFSYELPAFLSACRRALDVYKDPPTLLEMRRRAMSRTFSWAEAARQYEEVYLDP
jgi:starch synthase